MIFEFQYSETDIIHISQVNSKWRKFCIDNYFLDEQDTNQSFVEELKNGVKSFDSITAYVFVKFKISQERFEHVQFFQVLDQGVVSSSSYLKGSSLWLGFQLLPSTHSRLRRKSG